MESAPSNEVSIIPSGPDTTAPTVMITVPSSGSTYTTNTSALTLGGTAADNVGVTQVTWANSLGGSGVATGTTNWSAGVTLLAGVNVLTVTARDAAGNAGTATLTVTYTVPDTTPPTAPAALTATAVSLSQLNLAWTAATDNVGVTGYRVERCQGTSCTSFSQVATTTGTSFSNTGLASNTTYRFRVRAVDAAGNLSASSNIASATTGRDTTPPTAPTALTATVVSSSQLNLTWTASTDNVGVTGYRVERCQGTSCASFSSVATTTGTSFSNTGLASNTTYRFRVRAVDAAGNLSASSNIASATTAPASPGPVAAYTFNPTTNGTVVDSSGNGNTGVLTNGAQFVAGKNNLGVGLDGVNDYIDLGNPTSLHLTGSMTLSAWIYSSAFPVDDAAIISRREAGDVGYQLDTTIDTGLRTIALKITDSAGNHVGQYGVSVLQVNTWYHVAGVYDAANRRMSVYLNGKLDNGVLIGTIPAAQLDSSQNVNIGQRPGFPGAFNFAGVLDTVRIYNRALSQAEIQTDMNTPIQ